jgi:hypothetical protein
MKLVLLECADPDLHQCIDKVIVLVPDETTTKQVEIDEGIVTVLIDPQVVTTVILSWADGQTLAEEMGEWRPYVG